MLGYGYHQVDTPSLEETDLLLRKAGGELASKMYTFIDPGGHRVSLRPEFTSSIARAYLGSVDLETLPKNVISTHVNLNDSTSEGIRCSDFPAFSVQYHPESSPGPHDSRYLFQQFIDMMKNAEKN